MSTAYSPIREAEIKKSLIGEIAALPDEAFTKIKATVDGDYPIVVGDWLSYVKGDLCGCLLCDNLTREWPDEAASAFGRPSDITELLADFYNIDPYFVGYDHRVPDYFDTWAHGDRVTQVSSEADHDEDQDVAIVSESGRIELREIFTSVAALRPVV